MCRLGIVFNTTSTTPRLAPSAASLLWSTVYKDKEPTKQVPARNEARLQAATAAHGERPTQLVGAHALLVDPMRLLIGLAGSRYVPMQIPTANRG